MQFDKLAHEFYKHLDKVYFHDFKDVGIAEARFEYYYAESTLYIIHDRLFNNYYFINAVSPANALTIIKNGVK